MSLKQNLSSIIKGMGRLSLVRSVLFHPTVQSRVQTWPGMSAVYGRGWHLLHPFDSRLGTDTSGYVGTDELPSSPFAATKMHVYGGSQPSIIRAALDVLPSLEDFTFVDLGCGKGRPMLVASEFPFRELIGVELSPALADTARKNIEILRRKSSSLCPMRVETGDAGTFRYPAGNLLVFLYNPFGKEVINLVVAAIETALAVEESRSIFVVYYNPVYGECFDRSPKLSRYFASTLPYAAEERGFGPDDADPVVIWQSGSAKPLDGADARIITTKADARVALEAV